MRIKRLLGYKESAAASPAVALTLLSIVIGATGICVTTAARAQNNPTQDQRVQQSPLHLINDSQVSASSSAAAEAESSPRIAPQYQAWLDQDVRWLILPQERAAFFQLASDAERDHFIEQFWQRRDSPGSGTNSYRAEHYRRIAYANQHFAAAGLAGWESDRGRTYIVNGAPSTLEFHPSSAAPYGHPYETWLYASMQLTFVNFCNCGNYQLLAQSTTSKGTSSSAPER